MISSSAVQLKNLEEFPPDPTVRMEPPGTNPFVAAASISITQRLNQVQMSLAENIPPETGLVDADKIFELILTSATRDVDRYPKSARAHLNLGIALLNGRRSDEAIREFEAALTLDTKNYVAAINLARIRVLHKQYSEARELYEVLSRDHTNNPALLMSLAYISMRYEKLDEAETLLKRVVGLDKEAAIPRYHLAIVFLKKGNNREAISQLKAAARSDVRSPAIHQALGIAYAIEGDLKRATSSFKTALALAPGMKQVVHALASLYLRSAEPEKAAKLLSVYMGKEGSEDLAARELLAQAYEIQNRFGDARAQLFELIELMKAQGTASSRQRSLLMNNVGVLFARENMLDQGAEWFSRGIKVFPEADPILYSNLARLYLSQARPVDASQLLAKARTLFPGDVDVRLLSAVSLQRQGRNNEAIDILEDLIVTGKANAEAYADLGWILVDEKRDYTSAMKVLQQGYNIFKNDSKLVNNLAYTHLLRGEVQPARTLLESIPIESTVLANRVTLTATWGLLRLWEGNTEEGVKCYKEAEEIANLGGEKLLAKIVRQKMHLELARAEARAGNPEIARLEVTKGLNVKGGRECYREDLESLKTSL